MANIYFDFSRAYGAPCANGVVRYQPEDFQVDELLEIPLTGSGEHHWLHIQKRNTNTEWLARQLAKLANIPARDVSYAGLKDRDAVTSQWFSVRLPGKSEPDWPQIENDDIKLLYAGRHSSKLRRGAHQGNRFILTLREIKGEREAIEQRLELIRQHGVPNYYGEQRFGHEGKNVENGIALLKGEIKVKDRHKRSLYLSAVRSYLFNHILSNRVVDGSWQQLLSGEAVMLNGSNSHFTAEAIDDELLQRLALGDIHPSAPLWGRGRSAAVGIALAYESNCLVEFRELLGEMEHKGLDQGRRSLRMFAEGMTWRWHEEQALQISFTLGVGCFATSLLREFLTY